MDLTSSCLLLLKYWLQRDGRRSLGSTSSPGILMCVFISIGLDALQLKLKKEKKTPEFFYCFFTFRAVPPGG